MPRTYTRVDLLINNNKQLLNKRQTHAAEKQQKYVKIQQRTESNRLGKWAGVGVVFIIKIGASMTRQK